MRTSLRRMLLLPVLVFATLVAVACDDAGEAAGPQVLRINILAEPGSLDPQRVTDSAGLTIVDSIFSGLLRMDPDLELEPDCASEVPTVENGGISADGLTYTFRLRDGLMWSDGTPLVAQAFVDGARRLFEPGGGSRYAGFYRVLAAAGPDGQDANIALQQALKEGVEGEELAALEQAVVDGLRVEAPDDRTVVYHLNRQSPVFLILTSLWPLYPVRQDVVESAGEAWTEAGALVSNGPFRLTAWDHGAGLRLARNEHWHGEDVALETVEVDIIEDAAVAFLAYQNDELDVVTLGPPQLVEVRGNEDLRDEFRSYAALSTVGMYFNTDHAAFEDARVRQAFTGAIDREGYAEVVREGAVLPAYGWVPPGMPGHDEDAGAQYRDAIEESQALLEEAGYPGGEGLTVTMLIADQSVSILTAEWLKEQWQSNLGVTVHIDMRETASYLKARAAGEFDIVSGGWGADYPDPQNWLPLFRSGNPLNAAGFSDAEYDALLDAAESELVNEERIEVYQEAQRRLIGLAPFAPLYYGRRNGLVKPWVEGLVTSSMEHAAPGDLYLDRVSIGGREQ